MRGSRTARPRRGSSARAARPASIRTGLLLTASLTALLTVAACSTDPAPTPGPNDPGSALGPSTSAGATASAEPTTDPQDQESPTASATRPPDPEAPATVSQVDRPGTTGRASVAVEAASASKATWRDGLLLTVSDVRRSTTGGRGRGSLPGAPQTTMTLTLDNASTRTVDASRVVLTLTYGTGTRRVAQRVYDDATTDFTGTLERGKQQRAVYAFALPSDRSGAALVVDLDGTHALATLKGVAR